MSDVIRKKYVCTESRGLGAKEMSTGSANHLLDAADQLPRNFHVLKHVPAPLFEKVLPPISQIHRYALKHKPRIAKNRSRHTRAPGYGRAIVAHATPEAPCTSSALSQKARLDIMP